MVGWGRGQDCGALSKEGSPRPEFSALSGREAHGMGRLEHTGYHAVHLCTCLLGASKVPSSMLDWRGFGARGRFTHLEPHSELLHPWPVSSVAPPSAQSRTPRVTLDSLLSYHVLIPICPPTMFFFNHALVWLWLLASPRLYQQLPCPCSTQRQECHASNTDPPGNPTKKLPLAPWHPEHQAQTPAWLHI